MATTCEQLEKLTVGDQCPIDGGRLRLGLYDGTVALICDKNDMHARAATREERDGVER